MLGDRVFSRAKEKALVAKEIGAGGVCWRPVTIV